MPPGCVRPGDRMAPAPGCDKASAPVTLEPGRRWLSGRATSGGTFSIACSVGRPWGSGTCAEARGPPVRAVGAALPLGSSDLLLAPSFAWATVPGVACEARLLATSDACARVTRVPVSDAATLAALPARSPGADSDRGGMPGDGSSLEPRPAVSGAASSRVAFPASLSSADGGDEAVCPETVTPVWGAWGDNEMWLPSP